MSNIQTGAERMPHDLSHLGFLAGQIGRLITISTTRSEERFSRNAETDLVCSLLLEKRELEIREVLIDCSRRRDRFLLLCASESFFFIDAAETDFYTLSLHDALPISYLRINYV